MSLFPLGLKSGTFIDAPIADVERCLLYWASGHPAERDIRGRRGRGPLADATRFLEPRFFNPDRAILISHASGWTAFFDNHSHHFEPQAELFVLCERLKTRTCFFMRETEGEQAGSAVFRHYHHSVPGGAASRMVSVAKEGKWKFVASGMPLPFEQPEAYAAPRVRDRLTPELLRQYGEAMGIAYWEADAYLDDVSFLGWRSMIRGQRPHGAE